MRRFDPQHRGLQSVHPEISADEVMIVLRLHSVRAQETRARGQALVIGRDQTGVAKCAEILAREKREAAVRPDAADRAGLIGRAYSLRGIFDDRNTAARRGIGDWIEIGAQAKEMDWNDRLGFRRDRRNGLIGVDVERRRIDVDEHRPGAQPLDGAGGRKERIRRRDDLVARFDVERHQRQEERVGPGRNGDGVRDADEGAELALERLDFGPHDEALAVADACHRREDFIAQRTVLRLQVE